QMKKLDQQAFKARLITAHNNSAIYEEMDHNDGYDRELVEIYRQRRKVGRDRLDAIKSMREGLDAIGREIVRDGEGWDSERRSYERMVDRLAQQKPVTKNLP